MKRIGLFLALPFLVVNALFVVMLLVAAYTPYIQPTEHPIWACAGLTFPIFLVINVCFLFFWLILQRYKSALLPLIGMFLCCGQIHTYLPLHASTSKLPEEGFQLLSYNVMGFAGRLKENGKNPILTYLQESKADILCLQEYYTSKSSKHLTQKDIEKALKAYPYRHIGNKKGAGTQLACYSKYPILSAKIIDYPSRSNYSMRYEIKVGNDTLTVINNHLESNKLTKEDKEIYEELISAPKEEQMKNGARHLINKLAEAYAIRAPQADAIAREVKEAKHPYVIVCGDFNDTPISYTRHTIANSLDDAFVKSGSGLGISYNRNKFYFRIDHILTSKNLKAYNCKVDHSIKDSDHYPITCYIAKKE